MLCTSCSALLQAANHAQKLAIMMILDLDNPDNKEVGLLLLVHLWHWQQQLARSNQCSPHGPYDVQRSEDFFKTLFVKSTDIIFRSWLRCVESASHRISH